MTTRHGCAAPRAPRRHFSRVLGCCGVLAGLSAGAQTPHDATLQQRLQDEREAAQRALQENRPDVRLDSAPAAAEPLLPATESPCFTIATVQWRGDDTAAKWRPWLDASLAGPDHSDNPIDRCLGAAGIGILQQRVQGALVAQGYTTSRVLVTNQGLSGGVLALTVVPGRIHTIRLAPPSDGRARLVNALPTRPGDILNLRDIEQGLENLKRAPTADADIQIEPAQQLAGEAAAGPAASDLVVRYAQGFPFRLSVSADDSGTPATASTRAAPRCLTTTR